VKLTQIDMAELLAILTPNERAMVEATTIYKKNLRAASERAGLSRVNGWKIHSRAISKLRKFIESEIPSMVSIADKVAAYKKGKNTQLSLACKDLALGRLKNQSEVARRFGVTRACVSKRVCEWRDSLAMAGELP